MLTPHICRDPESTGPLVDLVLAVFQAVEGSEMYLNLGNMLYHDDIHFHVPVTISPVVVYEAVGNAQNIAPMYLQSKQYIFGIAQKGYE